MKNGQVYQTIESALNSMDAAHLAGDVKKWEECHNRLKGMRHILRAMGFKLSIDFGYEPGDSSTFKLELYDYTCA